MTAPISWPSSIAVPPGWNLVPFFAVAEQRRERSADLDLLSVYLGRGVIPHRDDGDQVHAPSLDRSNYKVVLPGDLVLNNQQAWRGSVGVSQLRGIVSPAYLVYRISDGVDTNYARHLFASAPMIAQYEQASQGVGTIQRQCSPQLLRRATVLLPPRQQQAALAKFLDSQARAKEVAAIHARRALETAASRARSVLLTRIFSANGPDDPSFVPLRRVLSRLERPPAGDDVVTAYRDGQVTARKARRDDGYTFSTEESGYQGVLPGDLVFHGLDGFAGAVGVSDSRGRCSGAYHVCRVADSVNVQYVASAIRGLAQSGFMETLAGNVRKRAVDFRNWERFADLRVPIPSEEVQRAVVADVLASERGTKGLRQFVDATASTLDERERAQTTAAVTGHLDCARAAS